MEQDVKVKSLVKVFQVLECFSNQQPELGITEIARTLGIQKSTVHNIAATCVTLGYLNRSKDNGKYSLGVKFLQFSYIINNHIGLRKFFLPYMEKIAHHVHETVFMGIPHGHEVLYIECYSPSQNVLPRNILGEHASMYCTGLGKAMLAFLPLAEQELYASMPLAKHTENTITDKTALLAELAAIRQRGYAIDNMEHEFGVTCIGVPVFGHDNRVVAAVSISAPSLRFDDETLSRNAAYILETLQPAQCKL